MTKQAFIDKLAIELAALPQDIVDADERLGFYSEMIDDRIESGESEEDAVAACGSIEDIISQIIAEIPLGTLVKKTIKPKRSVAWWEILLIILGSPLWITLLAALFVVVISAYAVLWSAIATLWAVDVALMGIFVGGVASSILCFCQASVPIAFAMLGMALFSAGAAIAFFFVCRIATVGTAKLTKKIAIGIKRLFIKKEDRK